VSLSNIVERFVHQSFTYSIPTSHPNSSVIDVLRKQASGIHTVVDLGRPRCSARLAWRSNPPLLQLLPGVGPVASAPVQSNPFIHPIHRQQQLHAPFRTVRVTIYYYCPPVDRLTRLLHCLAAPFDSAKCHPCSKLTLTPLLHTTNLRR